MAEIITHPANDNYRKGWDEVFKQKATEPEQLELPFKPAESDGVPETDDTSGE